MSAIFVISLFVFYSANAIDPVLPDCSSEGLYCVMDGTHDYEYYQCSSDFKGFRQCAPGTKCKGEQTEPYSYNPCVVYSNNSSEIPVVQSSTPTNETNPLVSSSNPSTPSVGKPSSETPIQTSSQTVLPDCSSEGLYCVMDGTHDYEYYECSPDYKGFRQCAPGTKCKGEQTGPYTYNPCVIYSNKSSSEIPPIQSTTQSNETESTPSVSSNTPTTPSVGKPSSETPTIMSSTQYNPMECKVNGLFCIMDGEHDYQYYECSSDFKGFRQCAPGTKCKGEQTEPYTYNPCVIDPRQTPIQSSTQSNETDPCDTPTTPSVGKPSSEQPVQSSTQINPMECKVNGLFCIMDGTHDYEYYECSSDFKGFRQCAPGTKCKGEQAEPYSYNPCVEYPYTPSEISVVQSSTPTTPSVGKPSSEIPPIQSSSQYNPMECRIDGLYCIMDGIHDYEYYECSPDFKGFRQCAPGTKCKGEQTEPYTYNPCVTYTHHSSEIPPIQSSIPSVSSSNPTTPSVGKPSSEIPVIPSVDYNPMECKVNGLYCIMDGEHDYQYYECSSDFKGFRQCAPGTKCKGEQAQPYSYNPCVIDPRQTPIQSSTQSNEIEPTTPSVGGQSNEILSNSSSTHIPPIDYNPTDCTIDGFFCIMDGEHDYEYYECSSGYKGFRQCAPGTKCKGEQLEPYTYNPCAVYTPYNPPVQSTESTPTTPSVGKPSSESPEILPIDYNPMECKINGLFCIMDGEHDYQYLECSSGYQGFRQCAPGTKCKGEQRYPYTYNPCVYTPYNPPIQSSTQTNETDPCDTPTTPSVGKPSSETPTIPSVDYNPMECKVNGLYCIMDGTHDYQYYECSSDFKGFRQCAPGTKCKGEQTEPYTYNPCVTYTHHSTQSNETESTPTTPSVGKPSSETPVIQSSTQSNPTECKVNGLFCIMDGEHDYEYYECSSDFKGFRQCAPGTKCKGEQTEPYTYNPCVTYTHHSSSTNETESTPTTPSVGKPSSETPTIMSSTQYNPMECKVNGLFCIMDGTHDYEYYECSSDFKGFRQCAPGTKCAGEQDEPYKFNPCIFIDPRETPVQSSTQTNPIESSTIPTTPSVGKPSSETPTIPVQSQEPDIMSCGDFECPEDGLYCQIDGIRNNRYCECAPTFKGSRPCAPGTWCNGDQDKPYDYNPCVFIDQTTWFGNVTYTL